MAIGVVTDLWYEMWFRDSACKFLWGKSQYFSSYLIIERSEAFNPVTLRGTWDYVIIQSNGNVSIVFIYTYTLTDYYYLFTF